MDGTTESEKLKFVLSAIVHERAILRAQMGDLINAQPLYRLLMLDQHENLQIKLEYCFTLIRSRVSYYLDLYLILDYFFLQVYEDIYLIAFLLNKQDKLITVITHEVISKYKFKEHHIGEGAFYYDIRLNENYLMSSIHPIQIRIAFDDSLFDSDIVNHINLSNIQGEPMPKTVGELRKISLVKEELEKAEDIPKYGEFSRIIVFDIKELILSKLSFFDIPDDKLPDMVIQSI